MKTIWQVEFNEYCQKVLEKHWPDVKRYGDIRNCHGMFSDVGNTGSEGNASAERGEKEVPESRGDDKDSQRNANRLEHVDLICGGFPCQDLSVAGKRAGIIEGKRSRLWEEFACVISEIRPRIALVENVPGLVGWFDVSSRPTPSDDGISINGSKIRKGSGWSPEIATRIGEVFRVEAEQRQGIEKVISDISEIGYDAEWFPLRASDFGAPHRRERVFIIAHARSEESRGLSSLEREEISEVGDDVKNTDIERRGGRSEDGRQILECQIPEIETPRPDSEGGNAINASSQRCVSGSNNWERGQVLHSEKRKDEENEQKRSRWVAGTGERDSDAPDTASIGCKSDNYNGDSRTDNAESSSWSTPWIEVATEFCRVDDGLPVELDGFKLSKAGHRVERLKALGNAVVPQVAEHIGRMIMEYEANRIRETPKEVKA
jgi:site-specific DNA-cytosine methylase